MRRSSIVAAVAVVMLTVSSLAEEAPPFDGWVFPGATSMGQDLSAVTVTSADKKDVQLITGGAGQYISEKPFHEVVAFYVRKSGWTPPNWSILGREFPGTEMYSPFSFSSTDVYREKPSVTVLHYIREDIATAQVLVTDHPQLGFISVSIARGKNDDQTLIQLIQHPSNRIRRGTEQSDARDTSAATLLKPESTPRSP